MKIKCENCQAVYTIDPARIPAGGKHGKCTQCGDRIFIPKPPVPRKSGSVLKQPRIINSSPRAAGSPKTRPSKVGDWKETKYSKLYRRLLEYHQSQDEDFQYYINSFCFLTREIPSAQALKTEVSRLKALIETNLSEIKTSHDKGHLERAEGLESENRRYRGMIRICKDLVALNQEFKKKGLEASFNELLTVLKDVDLAQSGR